MITPREFEQLVEHTLGELPAQFADLLENVVVLIEAEPDAEDMEMLEDDDDELLGIFRTQPPLPHQVVIFRGPILRIARTRRDAEREVRETVIHELGHYFGLDDEGMAY